MSMLHQKPFAFQSCRDNSSSVSCFAGISIINKGILQPTPQNPFSVCLELQTNNLSHSGLFYGSLFRSKIRETARSSRAIPLCMILQPGKQSFPNYSAALSSLSSLSALSELSAVLSSSGVRLTDVMMFIMCGPYSSYSSSLGALITPVTI